MARIGKTYLGGRKARGADQSELVNGAVAFQLDRPASEDWQYRSEDAIWIAEINAGQESIVARTSAVLQRNDVVRIGFEQAQRALDVVTFETNSPYSISVPGNSHVVLFRRDGDLVVQHVGVSNLAVSVRADVEVRDKDGRLVTQPPPPSSVWSAPLRYYRLSQTANELYEAYRNLFLALESLLNGICPKARREGEKQWLLRAFQVVTARVNLGQFVPGGTADPAAYLVAAQYEQIRCRLFHGKGELPATYEGTVNPEDVSSAYGQLVRLWREIARGHLPLRSIGGVVTYEGFRMMMDGTMATDLSAFYTDDDTPPKSTDTQISPLGRDVHSFGNIRYLSETSPGHVSLVATQRLDSSTPPTMIHRICSKTGGSLFGVSYIPEGLMPDDVDVFESFQTVRLVNSQQPRTSFAASTLEYRSGP